MNNEQMLFAIRHLKYFTLSLNYCAIESRCMCIYLLCVHYLVNDFCCKGAFILVISLLRRNRVKRKHILRLITSTFDKQSNDVRILRFLNIKIGSNNSGLMYIVCMRLCVNVCLFVCESSVIVALCLICSVHP